ncbi:MAG: hypothetical protein HS112_03700 [Zoogloeaceae bacterium]|nr:hypothetical protein [Zoogloeaceae bacterium]
MNFMSLLRRGTLREAGGWRRFFIAGTVLLFIASFAWGWQVRPEDMGDAETVEIALALWSIGALALAILTATLSVLDAACVWVGKGFGLAPATARLGLLSVLAGLAIAGAAAVQFRYQTVMPEDGTMRAGELCVVLDRWTGEARPCTGAAVARRRPSEPPRRAAEPQREEPAWRQIVSIVVELMKSDKWPPRLIASL